MLCYRDFGQEASVKFLRPTSTLWEADGLLEDDQGSRGYDFCLCLR